MTVLVGFTTREESKAVLERAVIEAQLRSTDLVAVHSLGHEPSVDNATAVEAWKARTDQARRVGAELEASLESRGIEATIEVVAGESDQASVVLLDRASKLDAELIIVGVRSRSRVGKLLLGSTAQDVLLRAEVPVLAVRVDS